MIERVDSSNVHLAGRIHSTAWKESHRSFCRPDFIESHTPERQTEYLRSKLNSGSSVYMLTDGEPVVMVVLLEDEQVFLTARPGDLHDLLDIAEEGEDDRVVLPRLYRGIKEQILLQDLQILRALPFSFPAQDIQRERTGVDRGDLPEVLRQSD